MFIKEKFINKKAIIIGGGKSGISGAKLISKKLKSDVVISDSDEIKTDFKTIKEENIRNIINEIDFAIKSPGITNENIVVKALKKKKIPIFSEIELALSFSKTQNIIMITGTNGKSTTTYLTWLIFDNYLKKYGKKAILCGNIGKPVSDEILKANKEDWVIMEVSSYQIDDSTYIKPKIAMILNITPDHLEHHKTMENYIKAKFKIFSFMDEKDILIINEDDQILRRIKKIKNKKFNLISFSLKNKKSDSFVENKKIVVKDNNKKIKFYPSTIIGKHNLQNQMAALIAAVIGKIDYRSIQETLKNFNGLEHRIEFVREIKGVKYINDSKATNVDSTLIALKSIGKKKNLWLILGGVHKNFPYTSLYGLIKKYVKNILLIGEATPVIKKDLKNSSNMIECSNLKNAICYAHKNALKGDIVLLSPACASFDQFKNFEDRGKKFKKLVNKIA